MNDPNRQPTPDLLERASEALRSASVPDGPSAELVAATVAAVQNRLGGVLVAEQNRRQRRKRIMRYIGYGTVAAAIAVLVVAGGFFWFGGESAAAEVRKAMDNAKNAKSVRFTETVIREKDEKTIQRSTYHIRRDQARIEQTDEDDAVTVSVLDLKAKKRLELDVTEKTAELVPLAPDDTTEAAELILSLDPGMWHSLPPKKGVTVTGPEEDRINSRLVKVYRLEDTGEESGIRSEGKVWIDAESRLPIRWERSSRGARIKIEFDAWNEEFDPKLFSLDPPKGYKSITPEEQMK